GAPQSAGLRPLAQSRGGGLRLRARERDRGIVPGRRRGRGGTRGGVWLPAGIRRRALVLRRVRADALRDPDPQLRDVVGAAGRRAGREPRDRRARADGGGLRPRCDEALRNGMTRLVTFDEGKVGELRGDKVVQLDVPTMREYFE